jgi:hypothetical protein
MNSFTQPDDDICCDAADNVLPRERLLRGLVRCDLVEEIR